MNDTTIQAYALSKGIDKSTSEMTNQEKIGLAMEMFMEKTAYAAGNYAKENETLAGSLGTAKAALTNFLDGSGDVDQLVDAFSNAADVIVDNVVEIAPRLTTGITQVISKVAPKIPPLLKELLPSIIEGAVTLMNGLVAATPMLIDVLISMLPMIIEGLITLVGSICSALPQILDALFTALGTLMKQLMDFLSPIIQKGWENIKQKTSEAWNKIKKSLSNVWDAIKKTISNALNNIKSTVSNIWNNIKSTISNVVNNVKSNITNAFNNIKTSISNTFNNIKSTATTTWNNIKNAIINPIETAKDKIKSIVDTIKGFFSGMSISFPNIPLPHFSISPSGWKIADLLEGSIPSLSIEWYAKAMRNPMLMTSPTIFGYNPATGAAMGGGEAGSEVVSGTDTLMNMIGKAVAMNSNAQSERIVQLLTALLEATVGGNKDMVSALLAGQKIEINGREFGRAVRTYA